MRARERGGAHQDLKRETPVIAQQGLDGVEVELELREAAGSVLLGQMRIPWAGKGGSTCGSVASALSSGAFSVVRTRPAGKANKVVSRQARPGASGTAHLACSSGRRRDEIPLRGCAAPLHGLIGWSSDCSDEG